MNKLNIIQDLGLYRTLSICTTKIYDMYSAYLFPSNVKETRYSYTIPYNFQGKEYKILCKKNRKRDRVLCVYDQENNDVTEDIEAFMGPYHDFHRVPLTPIDLSYLSLRFVFLSGEEKIFSKKDIIVL